MRLLLIEDDPLLASTVRETLAALNYTVDVANNGLLADHLLQHHHFDLVLLDLSLPDKDGLEVLKSLRHRGNHVPVLIVTARDHTGEKVKGLDLGADDYLAKPFSLDELEARIRALLRRSHGRSHSTLQLGPLIYDSSTQALLLDNKPLQLPRREHSLLVGLLNKAEQIIPRELLTEQVFSYEDTVGSNAIEVYISRLRKRLAPYGLSITTIRGIGYRLGIETHAL